MDTIDTKLQIHIPKKVYMNLEKVKYNTLTILCAGPGFGKTTAVNEILKDRTVFNYTCMGESATTAWSNIKQLLGQIDKNTINKLKQFVIPTTDNMNDILEIINDISVSEDTYLFLDNFQRIQKGLPNNFLNLLAGHLCKELHVIVNTHFLEMGDHYEHLLNRLNVIGSDDFIFKKDDIQELYNKNNIVLTKDELNLIDQIASGYIPAIALQLSHYIKNGDFNAVTKLTSLIDTIIYQPITNKKLFITMSLMGKFTKEQLFVLAGKNTIPKDINNYIKNGAFVNYCDSYYVIHDLLRTFCQKEANTLDKKVIENINALIGDAYIASGEKYNAVKSFIKSNEIEKILALPIEPIDFTNYSKEETKETLEILFKKCDKLTLCKYHESFSSIVFELFRLGSYKAFGESFEFLEELIENPDQYNVSDVRWLKGEYYFAKSFLSFNDIEKMSHFHKLAYELRSGTHYKHDDNSWTFGIPSVLFHYWSKIGALDIHLETLDSCLQFYNKLANNHGIGANFIMRAETELFRGDDVNAEILANKAIYIANDSKQDSICLSAQMILLEIAILRGDYKKYKEIDESIKNTIKNATEPDTKKIEDMIHGFACININGYEIAEWLTDINKIKNSLYDLAIPFAIIIHLKWLVKNNEYAKVIGIGQGFLEKVEMFLFAKVYIYVLTATAYYKLGDKDNALSALDTALDIALPDKIYFPFVEYAQHIKPLISDKTKILSFANRYNKGKNAIERHIRQNKLSPREMQVAKLAAGGLTNKEISIRIDVSAETVKTTMKNIFKKLNIKSRVELGNLHHLYKT